MSKNRNMHFICGINFTDTERLELKVNESDTRWAILHYNIDTEEYIGAEYFDNEIEARAKFFGNEEIAG